MNTISSNQCINSDRLGKLSIIVWIAMLIITGVYFRTRPSRIVPKIDWLIMAQLSICIFAGILGITLMQKYHHKGLGKKIFLIYLVFVAFSMVLSPYPKIVFGYWILLAGASLLTIGLVQCSRSLKDLIRLEKVWLITMSIVIMANAFASFLSVDLDPAYRGVSRLGMGWIHASILGYSASYVFCITFMKEEFKRPILLWPLRVLLILVIFSTRTRIPLIICFISLVMQGVGHLQRRKAYPWILISCFIVFVLSFGALLVSFDLPWAVDSFNWFNRNNPSGLMTLTGRTEIWSSVINLLIKDTLNMRILFGHGYGISRLFLLNAGHVHNAFLEHLLSMGLIGLISFILIVIYSSMWLTGFQERCREFSSWFAVRAATFSIAFYLNFIFGVPLGGKVAPHTVLFIFYLLALDKRQYFKKKRAVTNLK